MSNVRYRVNPPEQYRVKLATLQALPYVPRDHAADPLDEYLQKGAAAINTLFAHVHTEDGGNLLKAYRRMKKAEDEGKGLSEESSSVVDDDDDDDDEISNDLKNIVRPAAGDDDDEDEDYESELL